MKFSVRVLAAFIFTAAFLLPAIASARTDRQVCQMFLRVSRGEQLRLAEGKERYRLETIRACNKLLRSGKDWAPGRAPSRPSSPPYTPPAPKPDPFPACTSSPPCGNGRFCYHGRCAMAGPAYCSSSAECVGAEKCVNRVCK